MTAEIAVMNKRAVALAADSAVTSGPIGKIYTTANKLFALSKHNPIGIMIYGNAFFMDVPWETVIKSYRKELRNKEYSTVKSYCRNFIKYLTSKNLDFTEKRQVRFIENILEDLIKQIKKDSQDKLFKEITTKKNISPDDIQEIVLNILKEVIDDYYSVFKKSKINDYWGKKEVVKQKEKLESVVSSIIKKRFKDEGLDQKYQKKLFKIAEAIIFGDKYFENTSSVVITGFGKSELFPVLHTLQISFAFGDYLKYKYEDNKSVDFNRNETYSARIFPFAQTDVIEHFLTGIDFQLRTISDRIFTKVLIRIKDEIKKSISEEYNLDEEKLGEEIDKIVKNKMPDVKTQIDDFIFDHYYLPIIQTVGSLQINELGEMAETLVNLTSFKRRVTSNIEETVSGPIDVAVISKGDGFIWLKRKLYFKPELNHHFFRNYFKE